MNESGRSVQAAAVFYKLEPDAILVVHDESDLEPGRLQARIGGGLAGHNGLRSVAQHLGTPDFLRLRVGVGRPGRGDRGRSPTTCSPTSSRTRTRTGSSRAAARRSRPSTPRGSRRRSGRSTTGARSRTAPAARSLTLPRGYRAGRSIALCGP